MDSNLYRYVGNSSLVAKDPTGTVSLSEAFRFIDSIGLQITSVIANHAFNVGFSFFLFVEVGGVYLFLAEYIGYYNQLAVASGEPTIPALPTPLSLIFPDVLPEVREAEERIFQRVENALTSP